MQRSFRPNLFGRKPRSAAAPARVVRDGQWHVTRDRAMEDAMERGVPYERAVAQAELRADEDWRRRGGKMEWNPSGAHFREGQRITAVDDQSGTDSPGVIAGRPFVILGERWYPVLYEGFEDYGPQNTPERELHPRMDANRRRLPTVPGSRRAPPRPPSQRLPARLRRLVEEEEASEEGRKRFDPSVPPVPYASEHHFSVNRRAMGRNSGRSAAMREALGAPPRIRRVLEAAAATTHDPEVRRMLLEDRDGRWSTAVREAERLRGSLEGSRGESLTPEQREAYLQDMVRLEALDHRISGGGPRYDANAHRAPADETAAEALELWIDNTSHLSPMGPSGQGSEIIRNLLRKMHRGTYDPDRAVRMWEHLTESGAKDYVKHDDERVAWNVKFNKATRRMLAERYARQFEQDVAEGQYAHV